MNCKSLNYHNSISYISATRSAFTMIELVFIIVILGILASIAVPKMAANHDDAISVAYKQDIASIMQAVPAYAMSQGNINSIADVISINESRWKPRNEFGHDGFRSVIDRKAGAHCVFMYIDKGNASNPKLVVKLRSEHPNISVPGGVSKPECQNLRKHMGITDFKEITYEIPLNGQPVEF
ncbi:MAG: type II secretion system protein [Wolinella sp.]